MKQGIIRPIAICVFSHNGAILATAGREPLSGAEFYRPLGGGLEFGETSAETVAREIGEELGEAVTDLRYLGTLENIFTYGGETGHEIVIVYDGRFVDPAVYEREVINGREDNGAAFSAVWINLDAAARPGHPPVYPTGLLELLAAGH